MAPRKGSDEYIKLGVETDEQSFAQYESRLNAVIQKANSLQTSLGRAYVEGNAAAQKAKASFDASSQAVDKASKGAKQLGKDYRDAGDEAERASKKTQGFNLGGVERRTSQVGSALRGLGATELGNTVQGVGDVLQLTESLSEIPAAAGLASVSLSELAAQALLLSPIMIPLGIALAGVAIKFKEVQDIIKKGEKDIEQAVAGLELYYQTIQSGTADTIKKQIAGLEDDKKAQDRTLADLKAARENALALAAQQSGDLANLIGKPLATALTAAPAVGKLDEEIKRLEDQSAKTQTNIDNLTRSLSTVEASTQAIKQSIVGDLVGGLSTAQSKFSDFVEFLNKKEQERQATTKFTYEVAQEQRAKDIAAADEAFKIKEDKQKAHDEKVVGILTKRDSDIESIQKRRSDAELALEEKTANTVARITEQAIEANEAEFRKLQERSGDILLNAGRTEAEVERRQAEEDLQKQIDANRQERDDLEQHLKKVRQIQASFRAQERDAEYDRNFDALFRIQEQRKDQLSQEDEGYENQKRARQQALNDERQDLVRQRNFERSERRIALQNSLTDARTAYERQLKLQNDAAAAQIRKTYESARIELEVLNRKTEAEVSLRRQGAQLEITLADQTEQAKRAIFLRYLNEYRAMLGQTGSLAVYQNPNVEGTSGGTIYQAARSTGTVIRRFPTGGYASAGRPFIYNDDRPNQIESFGGYRLPGGMGMALPFRSGSVSNAQSSSTMNENTFYIKSNDPEGVKREIRAIFRELNK